MRTNSFGHRFGNGKKPQPPSAEDLESFVMERGEGQFQYLNPTVGGGGSYMRVLGEPVSSCTGGYFP